MDNKQHYRKNEIWKWDKSEDYIKVYIRKGFILRFEKQFDNILDDCNGYEEYFDKKGKCVGIAYTVSKEHEKEIKKFLKGDIHSA